MHWCNGRSSGLVLGSKLDPTVVESPSISSALVVTFGTFDALSHWPSTHLGCVHLLRQRTDCWRFIGYVEFVKESGGCRSFPKMSAYASSQCCVTPVSWRHPSN